MANGKKSDAAEVARRVDEVLRIRLDGAQYHDVVQYAAEKGWDLKERQIREYMARADDLLVERREASRRRVAPALAADLRRWIGEGGRGPDDPVFHVPEARNMVRQHKARLRHAGIPYQTAAGFADFHSLRKSVHTYLRRKGVALRLRQRFLRHAAADLATAAYDDERDAELGPVVRLLARLDAYLCGTPAPDGEMRRDSLSPADPRPRRRSARALAHRHFDHLGTEARVLAVAMRMVH